MKYITTLIFLILALATFKVEAQIECEACTFLVGYTERYLEQNKTQSEIEEGLFKVCKLFGDSLGQTCDVFVSEYTGFVIDMLENKESPQNICDQLKMCASKQEAVRGEIECSLCSYIVGRIEKYLDNKIDPTVIISTLDDDCKILEDPTIVEICTTLVNEYAPLIIDSIANGTNPDTICTDLKICDPSKKSNNDKNKIIVDHIPETPVTGGLDCPLCTYVASFTEEYLASNKTESEIIDEVTKLCLDIEKNWISQCREIAFNYIPDMINWFEAENPPSVVCKELKLC